MKLEDQVCSLELAQKLKELGVKQDSLFQWSRYGRGIVEEDEWQVHRNVVIEVNGQPVEYYCAFTVAELGELLPDKITSEAINAAYPMPEAPANSEADEQWLEDRAAVRDNLAQVFSELDDPYEWLEDGMGHDIKLSYNEGNRLTYHQLTDDWECNYEVISIYNGDTEADARAKMLIYLLENKLMKI